MSFRHPYKSSFELGMDQTALSRAVIANWEKDCKTLCRLKQELRKIPKEDHKAFCAGYRAGIDQSVPKYGLL